MLKFRVRDRNSLRIAAAGVLATSILALSGAALDVLPVASADPPGAPVVPEDRETTLPVNVRVAAVDGLMEGDSTMDGKTNIVDAMFIAQFTVGLRDLDGWQTTCADTNDDGVVNIVDAMHIAQYTVDPSGTGGVLYKDLWESGADDDMLPPA